MRTRVNFEATFGGHGKVWWANTDGSASRETYDEPTECASYPGSWAPAELLGLANGIVVRDWLLVGPFGGPETERFRQDPGGLIQGTNLDMKDAVRDFFRGEHFPPDKAEVDPKAVFSGPLVRGYWQDPGQVKWRHAVVDPLDTRIRCGDGGQVWYGAAWIYSPLEVRIDAEFQSHPQTELRWSLNAAAIDLPDKDYAEPDPQSIPKPHEGVRVGKRPITLRTGWNEMRFRGFCWGYPPFRAGLVLKAPTDTLWPLRLAAMPPEGQPKAVQ